MQDGYGGMSCAAQYSIDGESVSTSHNWSALWDPDIRDDNIGTMVDVMGPQTVMDGSASRVGQSCPAEDPTWYATALRTMHSSISMLRTLETTNSSSLSTLVVKCCHSNQKQGVARAVSVYASVSKQVWEIARQQLFRHLGQRGWNLIFFSRYISNRKIENERKNKKRPLGDEMVFDDSTVFGTHLRCVLTKTVLDWYLPWLSHHTSWEFRKTGFPGWSRE